LKRSKRLTIHSPTKGNVLAPHMEAPFQHNLRYDLSALPSLAIECIFEHHILMGISSQNTL